MKKKKIKQYQSWKVAKLCPYCDKFINVGDIVEAYKKEKKERILKQLKENIKGLKKSFDKNKLIFSYNDILEIIKE